MTTDKNRPWLSTYPPGVSWDMKFPDLGVTDLLAKAVCNWGENTAIEFEGSLISYKRLDELSDRLARGLQALGIGVGSHVGLLLPNCPHYVISFFAVLKLGATIVNYSPLDVAKVISHKVKDSDTDVLITLDVPELYPQARNALETTSLQHLVVASYDSFAHEVSRENSPETLDWPKGQLPWSVLLENDGRFLAPDRMSPTEGIALIQYTGGTTGTPKGAMLTHRNLCAAASQFQAVLGGDDPVLVPGVEKALVVLPLFHIYALTGNMLMAIAIGGQMSLVRKFDVKQVLSEIERQEITIFCGVPTMYAAMVADPDIQKYNLASLKYCASGGAPLPAEIAAIFKTLTGCVITEGWGMTETAPAGTFTPIKGKVKPASCGMPLPGVDIKIRSLDVENAYVPLGAKGEICVRGPNVMKGYWNSLDVNASAFTSDGYFMTGDVGYFDEEGYLYLVDRSKDMLLCSGYNVYPRVIEEAIYEFSGVAEVCVIGIPDTYRGQTPKAFVVMKPGVSAPSLREMQDFLKTRVGKHENIGALEFRDSLPKTAVGKLSKKDLEDQEKGA